jgi:citrate lyase gamma subunit
VPSLVELETVEDEFGSYIRTTIEDAESITSTTDSTQNKEDGAAAKDFIMKFIVEEALDRIALDNESQWESWKTNVAPRYIHPDHIDQVLSSPLERSQEGSTPDGMGVIMTDAGDSMPTLKRDGGARSTDKLFKDFLIDQDLINPEILYVYTTGSSFYGVTDEDSKAFWGGHLGNSDFDSLSQLNDCRDQNLQVDFNLCYTLKKNDGEWKISGLSNSFRVLTGDL